MWSDLALDKCQEVGVEAVHMGEHETVRRALVHFELTTRYQPSGLSPSQINGQGVFITLNDQSR